MLHAEIEYTNAEGLSVHSDICPPGCNLENINEDWRKFLHANLDEWLDNSRGTGLFYIGNLPK